MNEEITGRLEPEQWEDEVTEPRVDAVKLRRSSFDHEAGAPLDAVPPAGQVS